MAVAVVAAWSARVFLRGKLLSGDRPGSPLALPARPGPRRDLLPGCPRARGRARSVLALAGRQDPPGRAVVARDSGEADLARSARPFAGTAWVARDGQKQVVGETLVMSELLPAPGSEAMARPDREESAWPRRVASAAQAWLERDRRLVVVSTGKPLLRACFAELHATKDVVARVISR